MKLTPSVLEVNWTETASRIERFIKNYWEESRTSGIIVSLSGGIDSCTVAALTALAIGGSNVLALMLPEKEVSDPQDVAHSELVAKKFGITTQVCDITPALEALCESVSIFDPAEKVCKGNAKARLRMIYVYYYANRLNRLVCGGSDKSETMMGYFTKWGDVAADISPIMDLYKTQVRKLARHIGIPEAIIKKPPSPALWPGQTAEGELGIEYEKLDLILYGLEHFMKTTEISVQLNIEQEIIEKTKQRWIHMEHKRRPLLTAKLEYRTVGADFRLPRSV